jgi:hypothetical protein
MEAIGDELDETEVKLAEVKEFLADLPREMRVDVANQALPRFERLARLYNDLVAFIRVLETGADGRA